MPATTLRPLPLNTVLPVSGVSYRQDAVATVAEGDAVILRHDNTNARDPHAISVETLHGTVLGFVPRANDLNARLVARTPGGVWAGTITDVLRGETTGLRVRVTQLIGVGDARFGAALPGLRHRDDGYTDPTAPVFPEAAPASPSTGGSDAAVHRPRVFVRSGRELGELVAVDGNRVRVRTTQGTTVAYPMATVEIIDVTTPPSPEAPSSP